MKLAIIGATGFVGSAILGEALERGHTVTAIVRHVEKLPERARLTPAMADVYDQSSLIPLLSGQDAVISAFNPGWSNPDIRRLFVAGTKNIIDAAKQAGVKRLLIVGGGGSLEVAPGVQLLDTPAFPEMYKEGALGIREVLGLIRQEQKLDWTYLSPAIMLTPGVRTGQYRLGTDSPVWYSPDESKITTADLAVAILDEIENPRHIRMRFTVGY